jgi:hypothetical protein
MCLLLQSLVPDLIFEKGFNYYEKEYPNSTSISIRNCVGYLCLYSAHESKKLNMKLTLVNLSFSEQIVTWAVVVPWLRQLVAGLPPRRSTFDFGSVHVGFLVDKVALGRVFPRVLPFSSVNFIPPVLQYLEK